MGIGIPKDYFQSTSKPHVVTDIELDESVNAIHDIEDDIAAKMNGTTGHSHSGSDGQGPKLAEATSIVFHDSTGHKHTGTGNDGTNIPWAGIDSAVKSDDDPADIATTPAAGTAVKFSRSDHVHDHVSGLGADLHHTEDHASRHAPAGSDPYTHASEHHTGGADLLAHQSIPGSGTKTHSDLDTEVEDNKKALMLGSGNKAWVPCAFHIEGHAMGEVEGRSANVITHTVSTGLYTTYWQLLLPPERGGKSLRISGIRIGIYDADEDNYISGYAISGINYGSGTELKSNTVEGTSAQRAEDTFTAVDASGYDTLNIYISGTMIAAFLVDVNFVLLQCYYE